MNIVIVGNGILGCSTAFRLLSQDPNAKVILIGPSSRRGGATPAAGAMLNSFAEIDSHSLKTEASRLHFEMSYLATQMWPKFERELINFAGDSLPHACSTCNVSSGGCYSNGTYIVNNTQADGLDDQNFNAILNALQEFSEPHTLIDPTLIPNYSPAPASRALRALYLPNEGWLNPKIVLEKLDRLLLNNKNFTFIDDSAQSLSYDSNRTIKSVVTNDGSIVNGDLFILANGFDTTRLLARSKLDLGVQQVVSGVGISIEIRTNNHPHTNVVRTPNRGGACGIYTVPYFKGPNSSNCHVLIGASNFISVEPIFKARISSVAHLLESAIQEINQNFYDSELIDINVGNRPTTIDQYPLIGNAGGQNLFIASGTKRDGFHMAPLISQYLVNLIYKKTNLIDLSLFTPTRAPIQELSREEAVKMNVESLMSEQYQHGYRPSNIKQIAQLERDWRNQVEEVHDRSGAGEYGIHPLMFKLYRDNLLRFKN